jgi:PAS domain S-box-containing protein
MLLSTRVPYGTPLPNMPQVKGHSSVSTAKATGKPAVGDMYLGPIAKAPMVSIAVPVIRDGRTVLLLLCVIETLKLQQRLEELSIPPGWSMAVLDGKGEVLARRSPQGMEGRPADAEAPGRFVAQSAISPWSVILEVPRANYRAPIFAAATALTTAILAATLISVLGGLLASRRLARSVAALAETPLRPALRPAIAEIETVRRMLVSSAAAREEAESTLRESEERLRLLGDNLPDSYVYQYLHEADGTPRFLYISAGVERLHGLSREDVLRDSGALHRQIDPEQMPELVAMEAASLQSMADFEMELRMCRTDGEWRWLQVRSRPRRKANGQILWDGVAADITELKQAEEEILKLNTSLEQRVEERTAELLAANRELDAFAYAVSHDLRAPLRAMNGFSQALVEDCGEQLQGEAHVYLDQIILASRHMGDLIDGLLTLSRSTREELHRDQLDLSESAGLIRNELVRQDPDRPVAWQIEPGMPARGDARMLEVVMRNLIGNAWKYTAGAPAPLIRVYMEERDGSRCYCIADNGAGFDMSHSERLFKPFQRLHRQDEFPGIGIGLATVQRIVHRHGGEISAEAEPGKGAIFRFTLADSGISFS